MPVLPAHDTPLWALNPDAATTLQSWHDNELARYNEADVLEAGKHGYAELQLSDATIETLNRFGWTGPKGNILTLCLIDTSNYDKYGFHSSQELHPS